MQINSNTFKLVAASFYENNITQDIDEFESDFILFKFIKVSFTKYKNNKVINFRNTLNNIILIRNVFKNYHYLLLYYFQDDLSILKSFLVFLNICPKRNFNINGVVYNLQDVKEDLKLIKILEETI